MYHPLIFVSRVWFYGGGFLAGGTSWVIYDGANLAAFQDVVVVSLNYRTNGEYLLHEAFVKTSK